MVLLVGGGLLLRSFSRLMSVDPGFRPENVLSFRVGLPNTLYSNDTQRTQFFDVLIERLESLQEVVAAGIVQSLAMRDDYFLSFTIRGRPAQPLPRLRVHRASTSPPSP